MFEAETIPSYYPPHHGQNCGAHRSWGTQTNEIPLTTTPLEFRARSMSSVKKGFKRNVWTADNILLFLLSPSLPCGQNCRGPKSRGPGHQNKWIPPFTTTTPEFLTLSLWVQLRRAWDDTFKVWTICFLFTTLPVGKTLGPPNPGPQKNEVFSLLQHHCNFRFSCSLRV